VLTVAKEIMKNIQESNVNGLHHVDEIKSVAFFEVT